MEAARAHRRTWLLAAALAGACKDPTPPPPQEDPIVALAAALRDPQGHGPVVLVTVELPGAGVPEVERQLLEPLEHAMTFDSPQIERLEGVALPGRAQLWVVFAPGSDAHAAMTAVRDAMPLTSLPTEAGPPWLERIDPDRAPIFAMLDVEPSPQNATQLEQLAVEVMRQPGVTKVRRCGELRPTLVISIDGNKLSANGIALDELVQWARAQVSGKQIDAAMFDPSSPSSPLAEPIAGLVKLTDVASLRVELREGTCKVLGMPPRPTLVIWGAPEGIANATNLLRADARVRIWSTDDPGGVLALVATTLPAGGRDEAGLRWLAQDRGPAFLVRDGDEPAWLLAQAGTQLRSFSLAAMHGLHMWWPGAPPSVTARVCGPELDTLSRTAATFAEGDRFGELLDDIAVWAPPQRPQQHFTLDRGAMARYGVSARAVGEARQLIFGEEIVVQGDVLLRLDNILSVGLRATDGVVPYIALTTRLAEAEPAFIPHVDGQRCVSVDLQPRRAEDRERIIEVVQRTIELPVGVYVTIAPP